ncbi:MAG: PDZ domain-containing protein [Verrucomicrobiota bacterium]
MRLFIFLAIPFFTAACKEKPSAAIPPAAAPEPVHTDLAPMPIDVRKSVVRLNSTRQEWSPGQPWEKNPPSDRGALAAIVGPQLVISTAELVSDATNLELESTDGTKFCQAKVIAVDYEANLALLGPADKESGDAFFKDTVPFEIAPSSAIGDALQVVQIEDNGNTLQTTGALQSVEVLESFLPGQAFLAYRVKASLQSAASSFSIPVLADGKFAGVLFSYSNKDQICEVSSTDLVARFLKEAADGEYSGFPSLGVAVARTEDPDFRAWLKLPADGGGLYVDKVRPGSPAEVSGLKSGDVITAVDGHEIDRRGYYTHPGYGAILWGNLVRGDKTAGDTAKVTFMRGGKEATTEVTLTRTETDSQLVPAYQFDKGPAYLVKGGMIFQELSRPLLESFGEEWQARAPLDLLDALENPEPYQEQGVRRVVFLSGVIPTPATIGYERLRHLIVSKVNGKPVTDMKALVAAFEAGGAGLHTIEFADENVKIYLDENISTLVDTELLQRGIPRLSRSE